MAKPSLSSIVACLLGQSLALPPARGGGSVHARRPRFSRASVGNEGSGHILDSRLLQISPQRPEPRSSDQAALDALNGGRPDGQDEGHLRLLSAARQATGLDPPGDEFAQCGQVWEQYETVAWSRSPDHPSYVACAPASGDSTIGICRTDGRGHEMWEYCRSAPSLGCNGLGKLWFVFCSDLQRQTAPTPAPTAVMPGGAPGGATAPKGLVVATIPPTQGPTVKPTAAPSAAPTPLPTAKPTAAPSAAPITTTAILEPTPSPSGTPAEGIAASPAPTSSPTLLVITLDDPIVAGAMSVDVPSVDGLSEGDCVLIEGGGNAEVVCIAGFGSILLASPTVNAYPPGSTLILLDATTSGAAASGLQTGKSVTTTSGEPHATAQDDPHVCSLSGECFDIREPSEYVLLRVPYSVEEPDMLKVSAALDADGVRPCGLYVKGVTLSGSWLGHQVVRIRPYTRSAANSSAVRAATRTNFSIKLGNSSWRSLSPEDSPRLLATIGQVTVRYVVREQYGRRLEAQALEFSVGAGGRPAVLTVSQASHQALNLDIGGLRQLGLSRFAGVLGTEGHQASIEEPTRECKAASALANSDDTRRGQKPGAAPAEGASTLSASWR